MREPTEYPYPVTPETIQSFVSDITKSILNSQNITFTKGLRAWFRFALLDHKDLTDLYKKLEGYFICYFEVAEILEYSKQGFFYQFLKTLDPNANLKYEETSLFDLIKEIESTIDALLATHKSVVIFMPKLNSFSNFNFEYGNILYRIWRKNKQKILFVFSVSDVDPVEYAAENLGDFKEAVTQNIKTVKPLEFKDIKYSIMHWCEILDISLPPAVIKEIIHLSEGSASSSKTLVQSAARERNLKEKELIRFLQKIHQEQVKIFSNNNPLKVDAEKIMLGTNNITLVFTGNEYEILKVLISKQNEIISRDEIANTIWGNLTYEKYSDWSIDKFISQIRSKLKQQRYQGEIKTLRGRGFQLIQPA